jgi:hypothetical protein
MDSATIQRWIMNLGGSYDSLVASGVIPKLPLQELYEDDETLDAVPTEGVELIFWKGSNRFESIHIILGKNRNDGLHPYTGELPDPFSSLRTQPEVHAVIGEPMFFKDQLELYALGIGAWDTYQCDPSLHPAAFIDFQYTNNLDVDTLTFSLIDKHV